MLYYREFSVFKTLFYFFLTVETLLQLTTIWIQKGARYIHHTHDSRVKGFITGFFYMLFKY